MCGFIGYLNLQEVNQKFHEDFLSKVDGTQNHRGPDVQGAIQVGPCGLSHQRLKIIDLRDLANQPMANEDESLWLVFNGEIYNSNELRSRYALDKKGHTFRSRMDGEVILHLYE